MVEVIQRAERLEEASPKRQVEFWLCARASHKTSDCSFQLNIPDNSTLEPKKKSKFSMFTWVAGWFPPGRQQDAEEIREKLLWIQDMEEKKNPRRQFIYCCHAVKSGKYFVEFHWEEWKCVRWKRCSNRKTENKGKKERWKREKQGQNTSHIVSTTKIETEKGMPVVCTLEQQQLGTGSAASESSDGF